MRHMVFVCFCLVLVSILVSGCANRFAESYSGVTLEQLQADPRYIAEEHIQVGMLPQQTPDEIANDMFAKGYIPVGTSAWEGPVRKVKDEALEQAKDIGASVVLWRADYAYTEEGVRPVTTYIPGQVTTAYYSGRNYYGRGANRYAGSTTYYTPSIATTSYVPYSMKIFNYFAMFFARFKTDILGVKLDEPGNDYKRKFDTHSGGLVLATVTGGNAYKANIFPGDIIVSINGVPLRVGEPVTNWKFGESNAVQIYRDGNTTTKQIVLDGQSQDTTP